MATAFTKMQGLGNDFVVIDATKMPFSMSSEQRQQMADRRYGVGFDQLLVLESCTQTTADFRYRIFNADGSEVEQCGNGARCMAIFVKERGLSHKKQLRFATLGGTITLTLQEDRQVIVESIAPRFLSLNTTLVIENRKFVINQVDIGNPHVVIQVDEIDSDEVQYWGKRISQHSQFSDGANVGFMRVADKQHLYLEVYERGAGATRACGSGACAAAVVAINGGLAQSELTVTQPGGDLLIGWSGGSQDAITMTGPGNIVFEGVWFGE